MAYSQSALVKRQPLFNITFSLLADNKFGVRRATQEEVEALSVAFPNIKRVKITETSLILIFFSNSDIPLVRLKLCSVPTFYTTDENYWGLETGLGQIGYGREILCDIQLPDQYEISDEHFISIVETTRKLGLDISSVTHVFGGLLMISIPDHQFHTLLPHKVAGRVVYWRNSIPDPDQRLGIKDTPYPLT